MSLSSIPKPLRDAVRTRDQHRCTYCGVLQAGQAALFHIDHVIPRSKGGATSLDNLALQCPHCILRKSDKIDWSDPQSGQRVRLFHPLVDRWVDHFALSEDGMLAGKTEIGRATIEALSMNDPWPKSARALQIATGFLAVYR